MSQQTFFHSARREEDTKRAASLALGRRSTCTCLVSIPLYYPLHRVISRAELTEPATQLSDNIARTMGDQVPRILLQLTHNKQRELLLSRLLLSLSFSLSLSFHPSPSKGTLTMHMDTNTHFIHKHRCLVRDVRVKCHFTRIQCMEEYILTAFTAFASLQH